MAHFSNIPRLSNQDRPNTLTNDATLEYGVQTFVAKIPYIPGGGVVDTEIPLPPGIIQSIVLNIITPFTGVNAEDNTFQLFQTNGSDIALSAATELDGTDVIEGLKTILPNGVNSDGTGTIGYEFVPDTGSETTDVDEVTGFSQAPAHFNYTPGPDPLLLNSGVILANFSTTPAYNDTNAIVETSGVGTFTVVGQDLVGFDTTGDFTIFLEIGATEIELIVTVFTDQPTDENGFFIPVSNFRSKFSHYPIFTSQDRLHTLTDTSGFEWGFQTYTFTLDSGVSTLQSTDIPYASGLVFALVFNVISVGTGTIKLFRDSGDASGDQIGPVAGQVITSTGLFNQLVFASTFEEQLGEGDFKFDYQFSTTVAAEIEVVVTVLTKDPKIPSAKQASI